MLPYDPTKRYFGPQGSDLCYLIPEAPLGIPQLKPVFNKAAYSHDVGYSGLRRTGWLAWILDAIERRNIDKKFKSDILKGVTQYFVEGLIDDDEADEAEDFADLAHLAVRLGGWTFFRTDERLI